MKNIANCGYFLPKHGNFTSFRPPVRHHFLCRFDKKKIHFGYSKHRGGCAKFATRLNIKIGIAQKVYEFTMKLFFCQNSPLVGQSFWQKNSFITHILFELCLFG